MKIDVAAAEALFKIWGFVPADQKEVLGYEVPYCSYMYREYEGQHQYVWLVSYDGIVVETVAEIFLVPRNSRAKHHPDISVQEQRGITPLHRAIARDETIFEHFAKVYPNFKQREEATKQRLENKQKNA